MFLERNLNLKNDKLSPADGQAWSNFFYGPFLSRSLIHQCQYRYLRKASAMATRRGHVLTAPAAMVQLRLACHLRV